MDTKKLDVVTFGEPMTMFYANEEGPLHQVLSFSKSLGRCGIKCSYRIIASGTHHGGLVITRQR